MKRDMDLIRTILLEAEKVSERNIVRRQKPFEVKVASEAVLLDHMNLMQNAGLLSNFRNQFGDEQKDSLSITWAGYEFLETVRDDEIWREAKNVAQKAGGFSIEILGEIAKGLIKTQIKRLTGVEIME
tara:strand:+ start:76 stop:459 length:384 start_codon:yes stop_codon:yes gene_type:complete